MDSLEVDPNDRTQRWFDPSLPWTAQLDSGALFQKALILNIRAVILLGILAITGMLFASCSTLNDLRLPQEVYVFLVFVVTPSIGFTSYVNARIAWERSVQLGQLPVTHLRHPVVPMMGILTRMVADLTGATIMVLGSIFVLLTAFVGARMAFLLIPGADAVPGLTMAAELTEDMGSALLIPLIGIPIAVMQGLLVIASGHASAELLEAWVDTPNLLARHLAATQGATPPATE